jgi:hypothetical protein
MVVELPRKVTEILRPLGDIADGGLDEVGDPLDEVGGVLFLDVKPLLIDLLGGHTAAEHGEGGEVTVVTGVGGAHHVLGTNIWEKSSGTVRARCCWEPREVRGAKPVIKKWRRGKGIRVTASFLRSELS